MWQSRLIILALASLGLAGCTLQIAIREQPAALPQASVTAPSSTVTVLAAVPETTPTAVAASSVTPTASPSPTAAVSLTAAPVSPAPTTTPVPPTATVVRTVGPTRASRPKATATPTPATPPASADTYEVARLFVGPGQPGRLYAWLADVTVDGIQPSGRLMTSTDLGTTWRSFEGGDVYPLGMEYKSGTLYGDNAAGGVAHWTGSKWEDVTSEPISKLAVVYGQPDRLWGVSAHGILSSDNGGRTWQAKGGNGAQAIDVAVDPNDPNQIYGIFQTWGQYNVARSIGNGQWSALPIMDADGPTTATWRGINGLAIDGASNSLYIAIGNRSTAESPAGSQIWRTSNANAMNLSDVKWTLVHDFGPRTKVQLLATGWNPAGEWPALYAVLRPEPCPPEGGICADDSPWVLHRSLDGGLSWEPLPLKLASRISVAGLSTRTDCSIMQTGKGVRAGPRQNSPIVRSPDGRYLAHTENRRIGDSLYLTAVFTATDGSVGTWVDLPTLNFSAVTDPLWSPDSEWIALDLLWLSQPGGGAVYVAKADGTVLTQLATYNGYHDELAWSPDGKSLAFTNGTVIGHGSNTHVVDYKVYTVSTDGSGQPQEAAPGCEPIWRP